MSEQIKVRVGEQTVTLLRTEERSGPCEPFTVRIDTFNNEHNVATVKLTGPDGETTEMTPCPEGYLRIMENARNALEWAKNPHDCLLGVDCPHPGCTTAERLKRS